MSIINEATFNELGKRHLERLRKEQEKFNAIRLAKKPFIDAAKADFETIIIPAIKLVVAGVDVQAARCRLHKQPHISEVDTVSLRVTPVSIVDNPRTASGTFLFNIDDEVQWISEVPLQLKPHGVAYFEETLRVGNFTKKHVLELLKNFVEEVFENA